MEYQLVLTTVHEIADSDYVDRLADLVYDRDELLDPLIGLNDDGSLSVSFAIEAASPAEAVELTRGAVDILLECLIGAEPLRGPTPEEEAHGAQLAKVALNPVDEREPVYA